ncbi:MAG: 50S ribosomal protein L17 [Sphaerochaetaceae bacterium]|nr:50S ribosomal protein L17 [Sphaerochaetaceae bacterium]
MKHKIGFNALSRNSAERKALKRNLVTSLFRYEKIETTKAKAKEVQRLAEKMITRAKSDTVHNRRLTSAVLYDEAVVNKLFTEIAPLFADVHGGYTRVVKTQSRLNDSADMAILELTKKTEKKTDKDSSKKETKSEKKADKKVSEEK